MRDRVVLLTSFLDATEAHMARSALEEAGIACMLADENISTIQPSYANMVGGIKLMISESDLEAAQEVLARLFPERDQPATDTPTRLCPECGSADVERKRLRLWVLLAALFCLGIPLIMARPRWKCLACGNHWRE